LETPNTPVRNYQITQNSKPEMSGTKNNFEKITAIFF
jgi:hypothetical protein